MAPAASLTVRAGQRLVDPGYKKAWPALSGALAIPKPCRLRAGSTFLPTGRGLREEQSGWAGVTGPCVLLLPPSCGSVSRLLELAW